MMDKDKRFNTITIVAIAISVFILSVIGSHLWSILVNPQYIEFQAKVSDIQYTEGNNLLFGGGNEYVIYFDNGRVINVYKSVVNVPKEFLIGQEYHVKFVDTFGRGIELVDKEVQ